MISYSIIGILSTILDFIIYSLLLSYTNVTASPAKRISFLVGTINSFMFNKKITFKSKEKSFYEPLKYLIVWGSSFFINSFSHDLSSKYFEGYIPFIIATLISMTINFAGAKLWVFQK